MLHVLDESRHGMLGSLLAQRKTLHIGRGENVGNGDRGRGRTMGIKGIPGSGFKYLGKTIAGELVERGRQKIICANFSCEIDNGLVVEDYARHRRTKG